MAVNNRLNPSLGLIKNLPKLILNKLNVSYSLDNNLGEEIEVIIMFGDSVDNVDNFVDNLGGNFENLGYGFGLVKIPVNNLSELVTNTKIQYIELPKSLYTTDLNSNKQSCVKSVRDELGLEGEGVLIGFIDSGIDYTHPAFINIDGTTRIEYIYDLSEGGKVYDKNIINIALSSLNPFSVVTSNDTNEHGTHVAGIACAGGRISPNYYGVAPKSSIAMVKCTRGRYALSNNIMRGIKFLVDKSKELNMPLSINISLSTNDGAHNGTSLLEKYISTVATLERITISIAAGNEGEAAHHVGGELKGDQIIPFNVASDEEHVIINLYKTILSDISIQVISPTSDNSGDIVINEGFIEGNIGRDRYQIFASGPKPFDINGEISIAINSKVKYLSGGKWEIIIKVLNDYEGYFDMWMPISEGLNVKTKFLKPTILNTLGIPATVANIISVGSYDYLTNNISSFSGRGSEMNFSNIKPDLVAPGENIISVVPNESFDSKSGTSMATPHVTGIAALLMEWGIVKGNDLYLYGERLKYYLIEGAMRKRRDILYPDPSWGYGEVCALDTMNLLIDTLRISKAEREKYKEYAVGKLFIRTPE